jgi:hypothetical protein
MRHAGRLYKNLFHHDDGLAKEFKEAAKRAGPFSHCVRPVSARPLTHVRVRKPTMKRGSFPNNSGWFGSILLAFGQCGIAWYSDSAAYTQRYAIDLPSSPRRVSHRATERARIQTARNTRDGGVRVQLTWTPPKRAW